jgi:hypothetical protein
MPGEKDSSVVKPDRYETPDALICWKAVALGGLFVAGNDIATRAGTWTRAAQVVEKVISEAIT